MWRGTPAQVQSRLLAVEQFTEPFYQRVASAGLRLALTAPDMPPVQGSDELLRRLDVDELMAALGGPAVTAQGHRGHRRPPPWGPAAVRRLLRRPGRRLRPRPLEATRTSTWPSSPSPPYSQQGRGGCGHAGGAGGLRPGDYATGRKPREGEDALLVLDEFSALASGVDSAINLAERVRDVGVQVVVAAQIRRRPGRPSPGAPAARLPAPVGSWCSSARILSGCSRWPGWSAPWSTTGSWTTTAPAGSPRPGWGSGPASTPKQVRQAQPGEAWVIQAGQMNPPARGPTARRGPRASRAGRHAAADRRHHPAANGRGAAPPGIAAAVALAGRKHRQGGPSDRAPPGAHRTAAHADPPAARGRMAPARTRPAMSGPAVAPAPPVADGWPTAVAGGRDRPRLRRRAREPCARDADRPVACWTGCHPAAARVKGAAVLAALRSSRPSGTACGGP